MAPPTPYLTFDAFSQTLAVIETSDDNFIGIYDVTIQSEFEQPFVDGSTTPVSETIEF